MDCRYCRYHSGGHHPKCPTLAEEGSMERKLYMIAWDGGYEDGRTGVERRYEAPRTQQERDAQPRAQAVYDLGYLAGEVALESAENGHRAWGY